MQFIKKAEALFARCVWTIMFIAAIISMFTTGTFPIVKFLMLEYEPPVSDCDIQNCNVLAVCVINGTILGSGFKKVDDFYTLPIVAATFTVNILLFLRILGSRCINTRFTTFSFFCLMVFPVRFMFLAMQTLEFTSVGGDSFTLLFVEPRKYENCELFSNKIEAVFLMLLRFFLLFSDFFTFHILIVVVPLYYVDDKIFREHRKGKASFPLLHISSCEIIQKLRTRIYSTIDDY